MKAASANFVSDGLRRLMLTTIVAAAVAGMILTAPNAAALSNIERNCNAIGGDYNIEILTDPVTGEKIVHETCCYESLNAAVPGRQCDDYVNGDYIGNEAPPPPTTSLPRPPKLPVPAPPGMNEGPPDAGPSTPPPAAIP